MPARGRSLGPSLARVVHPCDGDAIQLKLCLVLVLLIMATPTVTTNASMILFASFSAPSGPGPVGNIRADVHQHFMQHLH